MVKSPIKIIDSGTAPTTANLAEGQIAFGTVDGATKLYGSDGTTVSELGGGGGSEVNSIAPAKVSVGAESFDGGSYDSLAIGNNARADLDEVQYHAGSSLAVGNNSIASDQGSTAIGVSSNAISGMAIGYNSRARNNGTALGRTAKAEGLNSVAIGSNSEATLDNELSIGSDSLQRRITHVSDPTNDQDAATKKYVDTKVSEIPAGPKGPQGDPGPQGEPGQDGAPGTAGAPGAAATITVGTTTTGEAGTEAAVTNSGTTSAAVLNFTIPKGAKGDKGDTGDTGPAGTTTFAGLTDQPTDNAALKTALDAKVSSVTAGEGISITGTATEPVISATGGAVISGFRLDYANAQVVNISFPTTWTAPSDGYFVAAKWVGTPGAGGRIAFTVNGATVVDPSSSTEDPFDSGEALPGMPVYLPLSKGDVIGVSMESDIKGTFYPLKQSTITPNEFTDTGWLDVGSSGLGYLAGPWTIPSGSSLRIRKFGTHVTVSGVLQCTEDIAKGDQQFLLSISSSDSHFNELHLPDNGSVEIPRKCGGMIYITEATSTRPSFQAQAMVSLSDNGKAIAAYITVVDFLYGYAQESIPNGSAIGVTFGWDTEA